MITTAIIAFLACRVLGVDGKFGEAQSAMAAQRARAQLLVARLALFEAEL
jgi:hypothetical protein